MLKEERTYEHTLHEGDGAVALVIMNRPRHFGHPSFGGSGL